MQRPPSFTLFPYTTLFRSSPCFFHFVVILYLITFARFFESLKNESLIRDVALRHFGFAQCRQAQCKDRKSTRLNSSHVRISYAVFCLKKKRTITVVHSIYT